VRGRGFSMWGGIVVSLESIVYSLQLLVFSFPSPDLNSKVRTLHGAIIICFRRDAINRVPTI